LAGLGSVALEDQSPMSGGGGDDLGWSSSVEGKEDLDADHDAILRVRVRRLDNIMAELDGSDLQLHAVSSDEPTSLGKAQADQNWQKAVEDEMASIEDNNTWTLCDLPHGHRAIGPKWVFKGKRNEQGALGMDYDEIFAPVARLDTVSLLIYLAALKGWEVYHKDIKSSFLNGDLQEEVYVEEPAVFIKKGSEHQILKLRKALYGLHQTPRAWNEKLDNTLRELGFMKSPSEPTIYTRKFRSSQLVVSVYVDIW
jgi:hypothetical protein